MNSPHQFLWQVLPVLLITLFAPASLSRAAAIALLTGENEYGTGETLPAFATAELEPMGHRIVHVAAPSTEGEHRFENIEALRDADLIVVSVRRRAPQKEVIDALRAHVAAGKPVVGLRTASHAFELRQGSPPEGHADWANFDTEVLGGDYQNHHLNKPPGGPPTVITVPKENATHAILAGLDPGEFKVSSSLYKSRDLAPGTKVLLRGRVDGQPTSEPVAWTHLAGESRVFYTSLGSKEDFHVPQFRALLRNGILWALAEKARPMWANWVEPDFPFFSTVLDARAVSGAPKDNLTPRGLVLQLGHDFWACFDLDLLRVSAVWRGKGVTPKALATGSYHAAGTKTLEGQRDLPSPDGEVWLANGLYAGAQAGEFPALIDPRDPAPSPEEPGRGSLPASLGRFEAVRMTESGALLEYQVAGSPIREWWSAREDTGASFVVERRLHIAAREKPLVVMIGRAPAGREGLHVQVAKDGLAVLVQQEGVWILQVPPSLAPLNVCLTFANGPISKSVDEQVHGPPKKAGLRWAQEVTTTSVLSPGKDPYVLDDILLPLANPWGRNMRIADLAFLSDGTAAAVTFDGDVWLIRELSGDLDTIRWKRFTSGLHEPLGIVARDDALFVFDRNGLWRLRDADGNGEADGHELFSALIAQTAETREFPNGLRVAPDGSFILAKGGQQGATLGKHNGTILRLSPDGGTVEVLARGLRQPFIGVHPQTGMITASDQQGHYIPSTPLHVIEGDRYYGFLPTFLPKEKYPAPIAEPLTWLPHSMNASAAGQVWLSGAKMGALNDALIHIGYNRPELFVLRMHNRGSRTQAAVTSLTRDLTFSPLTGVVNPIDGYLYVTGFQVWGTTAPRISGIARLRATGLPSPLPREIVAMDKGVLLRFDTAVDPQSAVPARFAVERWNYRRSSQYGSPHLQLDGSPGQERMAASSAYVSLDGKAIFVALPDMKPVMQMTVTWDEVPQAAFTPYELIPLDPFGEGFGDIKIDLSPKATTNIPVAVPTITQGREIYEMMGCSACHSTDGAMAGKVGPSWKGLAGGRRELADGTIVLADDAYLKESILRPTAKIPNGFQHLDAGMPIYEGVLSDAQVEALILFIRSFADPGIAVAK